MRGFSVSGRERMLRVERRTNPYADYPENELNVVEVKANVIPQSKRIWQNARS